MRIGVRARMRQAGPNAHDSAGAEAGFTIVELVIAVSIFAMISGGIAASMASGLTLSGNNRNRTVAATIASQTIEQIREMASSASGFTTLTTGPWCCSPAPPGSPVWENNLLSSPVGQPVTVGGVGYTVQTQVSPLPSPPPSRLNCVVWAAGAAAPAYQVIVQVTWPAMSGVQPVQSTTLIAQPGGAPGAGSGTGDLQVNLVDHNNVPDTALGIEAGVIVTVTGGPPIPPATTTDARGCVLFEGLTAGIPYVVSIFKPGYVDQNGRTNPPGQIVYLSTGTKTPLQLVYDKAQSLTVTFAGGWTPPAGYGVQVPTSAWTSSPDSKALPVALANSAFVPTGTNNCSQDTNIGAYIPTLTCPDPAYWSATKQVDNLFPWSSGYSIWAGDCDQADPSYGGYSSGGRPSPFLFTGWPGTNSYTFTLPTMAVLHVRYWLSTRSATLRATYYNRADQNCPNPGSSSSKAEKLEWQISGPTGGLKDMYVALPYGLDWEISVVSHSATLGNVDCTGTVVPGWPTCSITPPATQSPPTVTVYG